MVEKSNAKYKKSLKLRNKDPKGTTTAKHKDGQKFSGGKATTKPTVAKKYLKCFNRGGYVTCIDTSKGKHYHKKKKGGKPNSP